MKARLRLIDAFALCSRGPGSRCDERGRVKG